MKMIDAIIERIRASVPGLKVYEGWRRGSTPYACISFSDSFDPGGYSGSTQIGVSIYAAGPDSVEAYGLRDQVMHALDGFRVMTDDFGFVRIWMESVGQVPEEEKVVHLELSFYARIWRHEKALINN